MNEIIQRYKDCQRYGTSDPEIIQGAKDIERFFQTFHPETATVTGWRRSDPPSGNPPSPSPAPVESRSASRRTGPTDD